MKNLILNKKFIYIISVFILFAIPIYIIFYNTNTLKDGKEFLFNVQAVDPYDMFRGNYLEINFKDNLVKTSPLNTNENSKKTYYVTIENNSDGFAYFKDISLTKPNNTFNYFKTTGLYNNYYKGYFIETPSRYYMNEKKSKKAEDLYKSNINSTYVKVRVKDGKMVLVGVYINDVLIDFID